MEDQDNENLRFGASGSFDSASRSPTSRNVFEPQISRSSTVDSTGGLLISRASTDSAFHYYGSGTNSGGMDIFESQSFGGSGGGGTGSSPSMSSYDLGGGYPGTNNQSSWNAGLVGNDVGNRNVGSSLMGNTMAMGNSGGYNQQSHQQSQQQDWTVGGGMGLRSMSAESQGVIGFMHQQQQGNMYGLGDYGGGSSGNGMMGGIHSMGGGQMIGMQRSMSGGSNGGGNNRFSSSQMSQLGGGPQTRPTSAMQAGTGGSNAQGRALNKMLLEILRDRVVDSNRLAMAIDANIERMDCVNLATLLFHTGKKRLLLTPSFIKRIAGRFNLLKEELRAREASNALYGLKCMSSECVEVRQLVFALAQKVAGSNTELVAQAVGNALYGCQMMSSDHEEVRFLLQVLSIKVGQCTELLEAQNVGNALYGLRGMASDYKEVRAVLAALTPKVATAREDLNGQALGNSLYGLQGMSSREQEVRAMLSVLAQKVLRCREALKAQEVGNALYGMKRMSSDVVEVRQLIDALVPKVSNSPEILDAQAIGNSFYGMQNMKADNPAVLGLLATMADKVALSGAELDGQAMGNSLYGLQGMSSEHAEVRAVVNAITTKIQSSCLEMNAQELGNALYGLQNMTSDYPEVRRLMTALSQKVASSKHELTSQEIGNALFGLQGMRSNVWETRVLVLQMAVKIQLSHSLIDPQGISNSMYGIQRMTSDCEDVRMLVQALAAKIELSWKLLSAQHLSNCVFGLQGLSSSEVEVRTLLHAFVPKILACRDELSAKQVCYASYGMQSLHSEHEEVLPLIGALAEKLVLSTETASIRLLGAAMFGLQGLESSSHEVRQLVSAIGVKLAAADEVDATSLGNCLFGMQRMDNSVAEVCGLLSVIESLLVAIVDSGLDLSPQVCANALYGLQNCSIADESTRNIMYLTVNRVKELLSTQNAAATSRQGPLGRFSDLLGLYQALSLVVPMQPDLEIDLELQEVLLNLQATFAEMVHERSADFKPMPLCPTEARLVEGITDMLTDEPFEVSSGVLLHGFTACVVVRLKEGVHLQSTTGEVWNPVLVIEPSGGANESFPRRQLFTRLKHEFFRHAHGITVQTVPVSALMGKGRSLLRERLLEIPDLLHALYPPSIEDNANFSAILSSMGLTPAEGILSSLNRSLDPSPRTSPLVGSSSLFSGGAPNAFTGASGGDEPCDGSLECCLDFHETAPYTAVQRSMLSSSSMQQGMALRWIGDMLMVLASSPSPHARASPTGRSPAALPSPTGISVLPTGSASNSNKSLPLASTVLLTTGTTTAGGLLNAVPMTATGVPRNAAPLRALQGAPKAGSGLTAFTPFAVMKNTADVAGVGNDDLTGTSSSVSGGFAAASARFNTERLHAASSLATTEVARRLALSERISANHESMSSDIDDTEADLLKGKTKEKGDVDKDIEELEAELEIARLQAKLLKLRKAKSREESMIKANSSSSPPSTPPSVSLSNGELSSEAPVEGPDEPSRIPATQEPPAAAPAAPAAPAAAAAEKEEGGGGEEVGEGEEGEEEEGKVESNVVEEEGGGEKENGEEGEQ